MTASGRVQQVELLTFPEAAKAAGIGIRQLYRARARGELAVYQVGSWPRVKWSDVLLWLERCRRPQACGLGPAALDQHPRGGGHAA
jgi:excisionase family DNA binding protein